MKFVNTYTGAFDYKYIDVAPIDLSILASGEEEVIANEIPDEYLKYILDDLDSEDIARFMKTVNNTISGKDDTLFTDNVYNFSDSLFIEEPDNIQKRKK